MNELKSHIIKCFIAKMHLLLLQNYFLRRSLVCYVYFNMLVELTSDHFVSSY